MSLLLIHLATVEIVSVYCMIAFLLVTQSKINQINVHLEDNLGIAPEDRSIPRDFVLKFKGQRGWKGVSLYSVNKFLDAVRGRQFPLSLKVAGHQVTIIVDCCVDGVSSSVRKFRGN